MKAILNLHRTGTEWTQQFFPEENPFLLPIVNKPYLDYILDFCSMCGIREVLILDPEYDQRIETFLGTGTKWNLELRYLGENTTANASSVTRYHRQETDEPVLLINGLTFLHYDQNNLPNLQTPEPSNGPIEPFGIYRLEKGNASFAKISGIPRTDISQIKDYYDLNFQILRQEFNRYVLPGYQIENGIYSGMNVMITPGCKVEPPTAIGDHVRLSIDCQLKRAILGHHVIIDTRSLLEDTIVMNNTYVGADLEFRGMIVYRNTIIEAATGEVVNLTDAQLAGEFHTSPRKCGWTRLFFGKILALLLLLYLLPLYLFFRLAGIKPTGKRAFFTYVHGKGFQVHSFLLYKRNIHSRLNRYFHALSLDRVPRLLHVLTGHLRLIGDTPYDAEDPMSKDLIRRNYPEYKAGAFTLSELTWSNHGGATLLIDDLYLDHNRNLRLEFKILHGCLLERLFENGDK